MSVLDFFASSNASWNFSNGYSDSIKSSTEIIPDVSALIAGLNGPHLYPTRVISFTTAGVKSRFSFDAIVDFKITTPFGFTSFIESKNPEVLPVASTTKSKVY